MKRIFILGILIVIPLAFWLNKGYSPKATTVETPKPAVTKKDTTEEHTEIKGNYRNKELGYWLTIPDELTTREILSDIMVAIVDKKKPDTDLFVVTAESCRENYYETPRAALENEIDLWFAGASSTFQSINYTKIVSSEGNRAYIEQVTTYSDKRPEKHETVGPVYVYLIPKDGRYCAITISSLEDEPHPTEQVKQQMDVVAKSLVFD